MRAGREVWLGGGKLQSLCDGGDHNDRTTLLPDALPKRKLVRVAVGWRRGSPPGDWRGRRLDRQGEVASGQAGVRPRSRCSRGVSVRRVWHTARPHAEQTISSELRNQRLPGSESGVQGALVDRAG